MLCLCSLVMQQRAPGSQSGLKEEKLPPSPVMRGEPFNPAVRPEHHKHTDNKPSQPGHSQQSEYQELIFLFCLSAIKYLWICTRYWRHACVCVCVWCWADVKSTDSSRPVIRSSEPSGLPSSLQDKDKFKQESKTPIAPKKVQVGVSHILKSSYAALLCVWTSCILNLHQDFWFDHCW